MFKCYRHEKDICTCTGVTKLDGQQVGYILSLVLELPVSPFPEPAYCIFFRGWMSWKYIYYNLKGTSTSLESWYWVNSSAETTSKYRQLTRIGIPGGINDGAGCIKCRVDWNDYNVGPLWLGTYILYTSAYMQLGSWQEQFRCLILYTVNALSLSSIPEIQVNLKFGIMIDSG